MADVKQCDMCRNIFKKEEDAIIENMKINCILFGRRNANENSYTAKKLFDLCPDCAESIYQIIQKWPKQLEKEREKECSNELIADFQLYRQRGSDSTD